MKLLILSLLALSLARQGMGLSFHQEMNLLKNTSVTDVGNGGDAIECENRFQSTIYYRIYDYIEGKGRYGLDFDLGPKTLDPISKAKLAINRLRRLDPILADELEEEVDNFYENTRFLPDANFKDIKDTDDIFIPMGCALAQAAINKTPKVPGEKKYYVSKFIWDRLKEESGGELSTDQQAGLILHEVIYANFVKYGARNSVMARYFNAKISSKSFEDLSLLEYYNLMKIIDIRPMRRLFQDANQFPGLKPGQGIELTERGVFRSGPILTPYQCTFKDKVTKRIFYTSLESYYKIFTRVRYKELLAGSEEDCNWGLDWHFEREEDELKTFAKAGLEHFDLSEQRPILSDGFEYSVMAYETSHFKNMRHCALIAPNSRNCRLTKLSRRKKLILGHEVVLYDFEYTFETGHTGDPKTQLYQGTMGWSYLMLYQEYGLYSDRYRFRNNMSLLKSRKGSYQNGEIVWSVENEWREISEEPLEINVRDTHLLGRQFIGSFSGDLYELLKNYKFSIVGFPEIDCVTTNQCNQEKYLSNNLIIPVENSDGAITRCSMRQIIFPYQKSSKGFAEKYYKIGPTSYVGQPDDDSEGICTSAAKKIRKKTEFAVGELKYDGESTQTLENYPEF